MNSVQKIYKLLLPPERKKGRLMLLIVIIMAILETAGVASIAPFMAVIANPEIVSSNLYLSSFYDKTDLNVQNISIYIRIF